MDSPDKNLQWFHHAKTYQFNDMDIGFLYRYPVKITLDSSHRVNENLKDYIGFKITGLRFKVKNVQCGC